MREGKEYRLPQPQPQPHCAQLGRQSGVYSPPVVLRVGWASLREVGMPGVIRLAPRSLSPGRIAGPPPNDRDLDLVKGLVPAMDSRVSGLALEGAARRNPPGE